MADQITDGQSPKSKEFRVSERDGDDSTDHMGPKKATAGVNTFLFPVRRLEATDYSKGFIELLSQLSPCGPLTAAEFNSRFAELVVLGSDHVIAIVEDCVNKKIIATGSVFIEKKFIHNCGRVGHIEDVVVDSSARGQRLGQRVVQYLVDHAKAMDCYKVILDCTAEMRGFYAKCGFEEKNLQMAVYF